MAKKKIEIIPITSKLTPPFFEYKLVTHPNAEDALATFEEIKGYRPKTMYFYDPPSHKFQSWIIKE